MFVGQNPKSRKMVVLCVCVCVCVLVLDLIFCTHQPFSDEFGEACFCRIALFYSA